MKFKEFLGGKRGKVTGGWQCTRGDGGCCMVLLQTRYWTYDVKHAYYAIVFVDMLRDVVILDQHESEAMGLNICRHVAFGFSVFDFH